MFRCGSKKPYRSLLLVRLFIGLLPLNRLRVVLNRVVFGYSISSSARIGFGTILAVRSAKIGRATIGMFNFFNGPMELVIEDGVTVNSLNQFPCVPFARGDSEGGPGYTGWCRLQRNSTVSSGHLIDASGGFELGEGSWIGGQGSQFWTHGGSPDSDQVRPVVIGRGCYICSAARFGPGTGVADRTIVYMGSIVTRTFTSSYLAIGGAPAITIKENYDWVTRGAHDARGDSADGIGERQLGAAPPSGEDLPSL